MKFVMIGIFIIAAAATIASSETIRLESSQGILIPAPVAHTLRIARSAYASPSYGAPAPAPAHAPPSYSAPAPAHAAPSYSAPAPPAAPARASFAAPPCPRNYLFSCQPSLSPAPCSPSNGNYGSPSSSYGSPSSSYGSSSSSHLGSTHQAAAYSNPVPQYAVPYVKELY